MKRISSQGDGTPKRQRRNKTAKKEQKITTDYDSDKLESSEEDAEPLSSVQKYVEQLSLGLGLIPPSPSNSKGIKKRKKKDSETSSDEERWLDAIQSGKLEEVDDELRKVKDPKLMTARQRAMLERKSDVSQDGAVAVVEPEPQIPFSEPLVSLPSGYKEVVMTEEAIQRKALKTQKRKEKADEKREKDKKKTMERLLKKQEAKAMRGVVKRGRRMGPIVTYINDSEGVRIVMPPNVNFPLEATKMPPAPSIVLCQGPDCSNPKRYSCAKTGVPLCSLECYKRNIDKIISKAFS